MRAEPTSAGTVTILLADDHTILRETLRESLEIEDGFVVVGDVGDGPAAVRACVELEPDVVLLDIDMPGPPATATVRRLRAVAPRTRVIILSMYESPPFVQEMLQLGVRGYLSKGVSRQHLVSVIRSAVRDETGVQISLSRAGSAAPPGAARPESPLSDREIELLELVAQALSNRQIASRLAITEATVKRHLHNIFTKLGAVSRIDAVNKAVAGSLITPPRP
jgi:DNA-binding NarL/FixJ family response regulator